MGKIYDIVDSKMIAKEPTEVFSAPDEVTADLKQLFLDLIGEDLPTTNKLGREYPADSPAGQKARIWNLAKAELRQKVEEL